MDKKAPPIRLTVNVSSSNHGAIRVVGKEQEAVVRLKATRIVGMRYRISFGASIRLSFVEEQEMSERIGDTVSSFNHSDVVVTSQVSIDDDAEIAYEISSDGEDIEFCFGGQRTFELLATPGALRNLVSKGVDALQQAEQAQARGCEDDEGV